MNILVYINWYEWVNDQEPPNARVSRIYDLVIQDAIDYGNDVDFSPTFVMVVTYHKMIQYPYVSEHKLIIQTDRESLGFACEHTFLHCLICFRIHNKKRTHSR